MKKQVATPLILLLMAGVIASVFGRNEWQRDDVKRDMEPSSHEKLMDKLHSNNGQPLEHHHVEESSKGVVLLDDEETGKSIEDDNALVTAAMWRKLNPDEDESKSEVS